MMTRAEAKAELIREGILTLSIGPSVVTEDVLIDERVKRREVEALLHEQRKLTNCAQDLSNELQDTVSRLSKQLSESQLEVAKEKRLFDERAGDIVRLAVKNSDLRQELAEVRKQLPPARYFGDDEEFSDRCGCEGSFICATCQEKGKVAVIDTQKKEKSS